MYQIDVCLAVNTEYGLGPVKAFYNHTLSKLVPRHERTNVLELNLFPKQRKSGSVEKELGVGEQFEDRKYFESLAESYRNASDWETRRQILSIMGGLTTFKRIQAYVPGLTEFRTG